MALWHDLSWELEKDEDCHSEDCYGIECPKCGTVLNQQSSIERYNICQEVQMMHGTTRNYEMHYCPKCKKPFREYIDSNETELGYTL